MTRRDKTEDKVRKDGTMSEQVPEEMEMNQELPLYATWGELSQVVSVQGKALEVLRKQTQEMGEKLREQEEKIERLLAGVGGPKGREEKRL
jgi:hypothetical protein